MNNDPHRDEPVVSQGLSLKNAGSLLILLHGRGGSARDIISLGPELAGSATALLAPQAAQQTWYPNSFLAPIAQNEPWLGSALAKVRACVDTGLAAGITLDRIAIAGFSQGACLGSEFVARNPGRYAALVAFTGGLIGPLNADLHHPGKLDGTPVLLSSGDPDSHVPWERVQATGEIFTQMGATVQLARYPNRPHTILLEEIKAGRDLLEAVLT